MENILTYMTFIPAGGAAVDFDAAQQRQADALVFRRRSRVPPLLMAIWLSIISTAPRLFQFVEEYRLDTRLQH